MKSKLPGIILTTGLTLFSYGFTSGAKAVTNPEPSRIVNLENMVTTENVNEEISDEQHQKEIRAMVNIYIAHGAEYWQGAYVGPNGNLKVMQMVFDDERLKESRFVSDRSKKWLELYTQRQYLDDANVSKIRKEMDRVREELEDKGYSLWARVLTPLEYTSIKYDLENNVFYLERMFPGQEKLYVMDIDADRLHFETKDLIRTNKDLEVPEYSFEGPRIANKEKEWKQEGEELIQQYKKEVHHIYEVAAKRYAGRYGFPER